MSAETIETLNQSTLIGFAAKRGKAWHYRAEAQGDESNHYDGAIPVEDVRRRLFAWTAEEAPLQFTVLGDDGVQTVTDEGRKVVYRSDTHATMGVFGSGYQVHQHADVLLDGLAHIIDDDLQVGSAGLLKGGAWAWVQIEAPDTREVAGIQHRPFILAAGAHDGYLSTTYQRATQLVVCDNTLSVALGEGYGKNAAARYKVRHTSGSLARLTDVREALGLVISAGDAFEAEVEALLAAEVSDARWDAFTSAWAGITDDMSKLGRTLADGRREQLNDLWTNDERVTPWAGTEFGVVQAVNTYAHHVAATRGATTAAERNTTRVIQGKVDALDQGTLRLLATV